MPDLTEAVRDYIGQMPEEVEALLPELLPPTMDPLMPTYLAQLIPHLTPKSHRLRERAIATGGCLGPRSHATATRERVDKRSAGS